MKIGIDTIWGGERPKVDKHLLNSNEAEIANNAMLIEGVLQSWKAPLLDSALTGASVASIFNFTENTNTHWLESTNSRDYIRSPIVGEAYERVYFTGEAEPRFYANDNISTPDFAPATDYIKLGVPAPTAAPTIGSSGGGTDYKAYFYQFVNRYGEAGPNSPVDTISDYSSGNVTMTAIQAAPAGRAIESIRVFRTNTSGDGVADYQFVLEATWFNATTAYAVGEFVVYSQTLYKCTTIHSAGAWNAGHFTAGDDVADGSLGEVFTEEDFDPPVSGLKGLKTLPSGVSYGFYGNTLYLTEPFYVHAWPYSVAFPDDIVAAEHYGNTIIVIPEDGYPVRVFGSHPSAMSKTRVSSYLPCLSKRGVGVFQDSIFYPSLEGFAMINASEAKIITLDLISERAWEDYAPSAIKGFFYKGKYFGFNTTGGFIIDFSNNQLTRLGLIAYAGYVESNSFYIALKEDDATYSVYEWEGDSSNYLLYTWTSGETRVPHETNFSYGVIEVRPEFYTDIIGDIDLATTNAATFASGIGGARGDDIRGDRVRGRDDLSVLQGYNISDSVSFRLYVDDILRHTEVVSAAKTIFPLPSGYEGSRVQLVVTGYIPTVKAFIANSVEELMT